MKFACERCGKRFTSVDEPAAGRVYRIRCRCGNVIQIRAQQGGGNTPAKGGTPLRPASTATSGPRPATAAGDAAAAVRPATSARMPPVTPAPGRPAPPGSSSFAHSHPQATPLSVLAPGAARGPAPPEPEPEPEQEQEQEPAPVPVPRSSSTSSTIPRPSKSPAPAPAPTPLGAETGGDEPPLPLNDPFAAAAAHAARLRNPFDITAPVEMPRKPSVPPADEVIRAPLASVLPPTPAREAVVEPAGEVIWPDERAGARLPATRTPSRKAELDASVELSVSEQYPVPAQKARRRGPLAVLTVAVLLGGGAAAGFYAWKLRGAPPAVAPQAAASRLPPAIPAPTPPPPVVTAERPLAPEVADATASTPAPAEAADPAENARPERAAVRSPTEANTRSEPARAPAPERRAERRERTGRSSAATPPPSREASEPQPRKEPGVAFEGAVPPAEPKAAAPAVDPALAAAIRRKEEAVPRKAQSLPDGLDPAEMQAVISRSRSALEACVDRALGDPATSIYAGRKVSLLVFVAPNGRAEAALEEPDLDASPFGACLRRAASKMSFPPFRGEPVGARIPLRLGRAD